MSSLPQLLIKYHLHNICTNIFLNLHLNDAVTFKVEFLFSFFWNVCFVQERPIPTSSFSEKLRKRFKELKYSLMYSNSLISAYLLIHYLFKILFVFNVVFLSVSLTSLILIKLDFSLPKSARSGKLRNFLN